MPTKAWVVCIDWVSRKVEDTSEVRVRAGSAAEAKQKALWQWTMRTNGAEVGVQRVFILTKKQVVRLCY